MVAWGQGLGAMPQQLEGRVAPGGERAECRRSVGGWLDGGGFLKVWAVEVGEWFGAPEAGLVAGVGGGVLKDVGCKRGVSG